MTRSEILYAIDDEGIVAGFPYHDGTILDLLVGNGRLECAIASVDGDVSILVVADVVDFSVNEYWPGVIIGSIVSARLDSMGKQGEWSLQWFLDHCGERSDRAEIDRYTRKLLSIQGDARLVQIRCSYGGFVSAIGREFRVLKS